MSYRSAPIAGVLAVVAFLVAVVIDESGSPPGADASGSELAAHLNDNVYRFALAALAWGIGTIALVAFLDAVRARVARGSDYLARAGFALGVGAALMLLASWLPEVGGSLASREELHRDLEPGAAEVFSSIGTGFFFGGEVLLAGFLLAVGLAAVRTRVLPVWLGWISIVLGVVALIPPIGWAVVIVAFPLWLLGVSLLLWREEEATPALSAV
jgi:hypothetical protein